MIMNKAIIETAQDPERWLGLNPGGTKHEYLSRADKINYFPNKNCVLDPT